VEEIQELPVEDFGLAGGDKLKSACQAYTIIGSLNEARDNAILFPTRVAGRIEDNLAMVGPGRALDPTRFAIIIPALIGNGEASSPSNTTGLQSGADFPEVVIEDAVRLQHILIVKHLRIPALHAAVGWSMGGQQAYQWASLFPDLVPRLAVICGAAKTSPFSRMFLTSLKAALTADAAWQGGRYEQPPVVGLKALGRVWAPWAFSEPWYRRGGFVELGFSDLDAFVAGFWDAVPLGWDANDILCQFDMWLRHDLGRAAGDDTTRALRAITARTLLMPCSTDAYFQCTDSVAEAAEISSAKVVPIESDWGHMAGAGMNAADAAFIDAHLTALLHS